MINSWKNIKHVVFWSGGFDSTALLIETAAKYATYNEPVLAISVYDKSSISNADADKAAREKIKQILPETFYAVLLIACGLEQYL